MSFRTVVITNQAKLNYKNKFLVVKQELDEKYIHLSEIDTIIIDSISISISSYLLKELSSNKINIIFCDEKHNPFGELISFYSSHNSSKKIMSQMKWSLEEKNLLWQQIICNKILNQALLLYKIDASNYDLLLDYSMNIEPGDKNNREAHAAKVYFNSLFGKRFIRHNEDTINASLNYGYSILLSAFNKEIIQNGYLTQIGIHHKNEFNCFNFSCDLMEPFRVIIDDFVYKNRKIEFDSKYKMALVDLFNMKYEYNNKKYTLKDIIKLYVKNIFDVLEKNSKYIDFMYYEK